MNILQEPNIIFVGELEEGMDRGRQRRGVTEQMKDGREGGRADVGWKGGRKSR